MYEQPTGVKALLNNRRVLFIGGGALVVIILVIGVLLSSGGDPLQGNLQHLTARYDNLVKLTRDAPKQIKDDELNKFNSEANILFSSDDAAMSGLLLARYGSKDLPQEIVTAEATTSSDAKLTEAALLGKYDDSYKTVMDQKLVGLQALLDEARGNSTNSDTLNKIKTARSNSETLRDRLKQVNL